MKNLITLFLCLFFTINLFAQELGEYYYGNGKNEFIQTTIIDNDSTLFTLGAKKNPLGIHQFWFQKINMKTMKVVFEKLYPSVNPQENEAGHTMIETADGGFLLGGGVIDSWGFTLGKIIKISAAGSLEWSESYEQLVDVQGIKVDDNGYYICGYFQFAAPEEGVLLKINKSGKLLWDRKYENLSQTSIKHIYKTSDGNLLLFGRTSVNAVGFKGIIVYKVEKDGTEIWHKQYDTQFDENSYQYNKNWMASLGMVQLFDGNFILVDPQNEKNTALLKINPEGDLLWKKVINAPFDDDYSFDVQLLPNNNFLICGKNTQGNNSRAFAIVANDGGNDLQRKYFGSTKGNSFFLGSKILSNGKLLFAGQYSPNTVINSKGWITITNQNLGLTDHKLEAEIVLDLNKNCKKDASETILPSWFVKTNIHNDSLLLSDAKGTVVVDFVADSIKMELINQDANLWNICKSKQTVKFDKTKLVQKITFFIQPKEDCPKPQISITQPELVRCQKARYFVNIQNNGNTDSEDLLAEITFDKYLDVLSASQPFSKKNNTISFTINKLEKFSSQQIEIITRLSCNAQLSIAHEVKAELLPIECTQPWSKGKIAVSAVCANNQVSLSIKNIGNEDISTPVKYKIWDNNYVLKADVLTLLKGESKDFSYPANGHTFNIQCEQIPSYPFEKVASKTLESCGTNGTLIPSVGFGDAFRHSDGVPNIAYTSIMNSTGLPNKIEELSGKFGFYHYIRDLQTLEYCVRARNSTNNIQNNVSFQLVFDNNAFDIKTFRILGANNQSATSTLSNSSKVTINLKDLNLKTFIDDSTKSDVFLRFAIKPKSTIPPDSSSLSFIGIRGKAFFNEYESIDLNPAWQNYSIQTQKLYKPEYKDLSNIKEYGGKYYDFASNVVQTNDNAIIMTGVGNSYSGHSAFQPFLIKINKSGNLIWQNSYDLEVDDIYFHKTLIDKNNDIYIIGTIVPKGGSDTFEDYETLLAKIDKSGKLLWTKTYKMGFLGGGSVGKGALFSSDSSIVISGYSDNGGNSADNYLMKIDRNGNLIWKKNYIVNGVVFDGTNIQELQDGSFIITGEDQNNSSIIYYQKVDENGNEIWVRTYTLEDKKIGFHFVSSMVEPDESVIFLGYSIWETLNKDYVLTPNIVKLDKNGKKIFEKLPIIGKDSTFWPTGILKNEQNQYFIYGEMSSQITDFGDNIALARFDKNFKLEWYNNYERVTSEWPKDAVFISKDTMLLWGFHQRRTNDDNINCLLITADLKEKGLIVDTKNSEKEVLYVNCFPNPSSDQINFQIVRTEDELYNSDIHIFNSFGTLITIIQASKKELTTFDTSQLPNGVYFYSINSINNEESKAFYSGNFVIIHK